MHTPPALYFFPQAPDITNIQHAPMPHIHHSPPAHHIPRTPHRHPAPHRCHTYITHLQHTTAIHTPHRHPAQRRCHHPPVRPQGNSALAAIQRSADGPPPSVRPLNPHTTKKSLIQNTPSAENTPLYTTNIPNKGYSLYIQHKLPTQAPHRLITPTTNAQDGLPEGRLHGRDPVRRSKPLVILSA